MKRKFLLIGLILFFQIASVLIFSTKWAFSQSIPATSGWYQISGSDLRSVCPPNNFGGSGYGFNNNCQNVTEAWNSAIFDTLRNRLVIWGGGHNDYYGNEMYALDLDDLTMTRLTDPGVPIATSCVESLVSGTQPNSRHTYDGIEYIASYDRMFVFGGSLACASGNFSQGTWTYDFATSTWQNMSPSGSTPRADPGIVTAYDSNTGKVYVRDNYDLYVYDYSTNAYTRLTSTAIHTGYSTTAVIDPTREMLVIVGSNSGSGLPQLFTTDISGNDPNYTLTARTASGDDDMEGVGWPGLAYDPHTDRIVAWDGGNTVYSLNLDNYVWTSTTYTGGPSAVANGTMGRWAYSPDSGVFVVVNDIDDNAYTLRLPGGPPPIDTSPPTTPQNLTANVVSSSEIDLSWNASSDNVGVAGYRIYRGGSMVATSNVTSYHDTSLTPETTYTYSVAAYDAAGNVSAQSSPISVTTSSGPPGGDDFQVRCSVPGVVKCVGFDNASDIPVVNWMTGGFNAGHSPYGIIDDGAAPIELDTNVKASGNSSLKFTIPPFSGANTSGSYYTNFSDDGSIQFGEGEEFYVQWRQRFSTGFTTYQFAVTQGSGGFKQTITGNGDTATFAASSCSDLEVATNNGAQRGVPQGYHDCGRYTGLDEYDIPNCGNWDIQSEQNCCYPGPYTDPPCFAYYENEWMTFQVYISVGTWNTASSTIRIWVAREGQPSELVIEETNYTLYRDDPTGWPSVYGKIWLLPYNSYKDSTENHPTYYTWYDELIISGTRIPDPTSSSGSAPAPPENLRIVP